MGERISGCPSARDSLRQARDRLGYGRAEARPSGSPVGVLEWRRYERQCGGRGRDRDREGGKGARAVRGAVLEAGVYGGGGGVLPGARARAGGAVRGEGGGDEGAGHGGARGGLAGDRGAAESSREAAGVPLRTGEGEGGADIAEGAGREHESQPGVRGGDGGGGVAGPGA